MNWSARTCTVLALALGTTALPLLGCSSSSSHPTIAVMTELTFAREEPETVSEGFDLDGRTSDETDAEGCRVEDLVSPGGEPGIDNSFASVLPLLELTEGVALEALIQATVNSGELLIMLEMNGLRDWSPGACVALDVLQGTGPPSVGSDDRILAGQTFDRDHDAPSSEIDCATITGARLRGSPFSLRLPLQIFDETIDLTLLDGVLEVHLLGDGRYRGLFAGGVDVEEIRTNVENLDGVGDEVPALINTVLDTRADLSPDAAGNCQRISVVFAFTAVSAYLFDDES